LQAGLCTRSFYADRHRPPAAALFARACSAGYSPARSSPSQCTQPRRLTRSFVSFFLSLLADAHALHVQANPWGRQGAGLSRQLAIDCPPSLPILPPTDTNVKSCRKLHSLLTGLQAQLKGGWVGGQVAVFAAAWKTWALHCALTGQLGRHIWCKWRCWTVVLSTLQLQLPCTIIPAVCCCSLPVQRRTTLATMCTSGQRRCSSGCAGACVPWSSSCARLAVQDSRAA